MDLKHYQHLGDMRLGFESGRLVSKYNTLYYEVKFKMSLAFFSFEEVVNKYISNYFLDPINAIRPELDGLANYTGYNLFDRQAGNITSSANLYRVFVASDNYKSDWTSRPDGLEARYDQPGFEIAGENLFISARQHFRWMDGRNIEIDDLPMVPFSWNLNAMRGHTSESIQPESSGTKVVLGYAQAELVNIGGIPLRKGTLYMVGSALQLGEISPDKIQTALR